MIRRVLDALHRAAAEQPPPYATRPNALSRDAARSERLRREARMAETPARLPASQSEAERARRDPRPLPPAPPARQARLAASLRSRSELRRALLMKEILGPPAALRWPQSGDPDL